MAGEWDWIDDKEEEIKEERSKGYFDIVEGKQKFVLLSHCAPYAQVYEGGKYRPAQEGEKGASIKGVCWVMQSEEIEVDGKKELKHFIKQAKLPYTLVKVIRGLQQDPEWEFEIPFPREFTLTTVGAKTKEVKYTLTPSPKTIKIPAEVLAELKKKPSPEEVVEKIKGKSSGDTAKYPTAEDEEINPEDIPFE